MSCSDLPDWYLQRRIAVVDLRSATWRKARAEVVPPGYAPDECVRRLAKAGRLRRLVRGRFVVVDPVRETSAIAVASGLFADEPHYVTTDAALAFHGAIDQPVLQITIVVARRRRPINIGPSVVRPVMLSSERLAAADAYDTSADGFRVRVATREQSVVDGLVEPAWLVYADLLPEVLASFTETEIERTAASVLARSTAAAQRLGYLLEDADRPLPASLAGLRPLRAVRLRPKHKTKGPYSTRWRVYG